MARHEHSEDPPLTRLELGRLRPKTLLAREPWQLVSKIRIPQLTRRAHHSGQGGNVEFFSSQINFLINLTRMPLPTYSTCLHVAG